MSSVAIKYGINNPNSDTFSVGMKKVINFSEGVRESLRRLSNLTWMAEELHKVVNFYLPNISVSSSSDNEYLHIHSQ